MGHPPSVRLGMTRWVGELTAPLKPKGGLNGPPAVDVDQNETNLKVKVRVFCE